MTKPLTKAQARALKKWSEAGASHRKFLGVREDVYFKLVDAGHLTGSGIFHREISPEGEAALSAYEQKHGEIKKDWF